MNRSPIPAAVCVGLAMASPLAAQIDAAPPLEIFYDFTLIDGSGEPPIEDAAIAVRGNEIVAVATRGQLLVGPDAPRDAVPVSLGGGWVIPGLVDAHVHLATTPNRARAEAELYRQLYGGVVAVRDMAGDARALASLARDSRLGEIVGPDVYYAALMAGPSFFGDPRPQASAAGETAGEVPWMQAVTPDTDMALAVARAKGTWATGIKIYANLAAEEVERITAEAHRQGMPVWAHSMVFPARPLEVVESGVDVVSHVCRLAWEAMAEAPAEYHHDQSPAFGNFTVESAVFAELFEAMRDHGTILDATLALYDRADSVRREHGNRAQGERCDAGFARELVAAARDHGIPIAAGTDFSSVPGDPYPALHSELEALVRAGLSPMEAIVAGTRTSASAIGVEKRYGTLRPGGPVTFVLLAADPLEDIGNLRTVRAVWKNAVRYDRAAYRPRADEDALGETSVPRGGTSPREVIELWLAMWRRHDADRLGQLFLPDATLTYFPPDTPERLEGFDAVAQYHRDRGFVPGGARSDRELWIDDPLVADFGDSAVVTARWHYGNRVEGGGETGRMTMVLVRTSNGYEISHMNMTRDASE